MKLKAQADGLARRDRATANADGAATIAALPRGDLLLPYQQSAVAKLFAGVSLLVIEKSRRIGLTWGLAAYAVLRAGGQASAGGMNAWYMGYDLEMAREFDTALDKAQGEGRITPASRPEYLAMCKAQGGLESFERLAATLPVIVSPKPIVPGRAASGGDNPAGLTDEQRAVCRALGQTEAGFAKSLKVEA